MELRNHIERLTLTQFSGFTVTRGLDGTWIDSRGRRFNDRIDEYRLATFDEAALLAWAVGVGRLLGQYSVYVRCPNGRAMILPTADESAAASCQCTYVTHYAVAPEAIVNLLRLPGRRGNRGDWTLRYTYFDEERRFVRIILTAESLPNDLTRTADGIAITGLTGTRTQVLATDDSEIARVKTFLTAKLAPFER